MTSCWSELGVQKTLSVPSATYECAKCHWPLCNVPILSMQNAISCYAIYNFRRWNVPFLGAKDCQICPNFTLKLGQIFNSTSSSIVMPCICFTTLRTQMLAAALLAAFPQKTLSVRFEDTGWYVSDIMSLGLLAGCRCLSVSFMCSALSRLFWLCSVCLLIGT